MKRYTKIVSVALLLILCVMAVTPMIVMAIANPDTPPTVNAVYVYEFSDGSVGVLVDYYLDYAAVPTETATDSFLAVFVDTDGTTQIKAVAPYTYQGSGYGRGIIWIPFTSTEVATYGLDSADVALYKVWLIGNPTLSWPGGIAPKTIASIDQWDSTGDISVLLALRILYEADQLELAWSLDMVSATALGNRLTSLGENYFISVIPDLRTLAPGAFASVESSPTYTPVDYSSDFGATASNGTATIAGSPVTLAAGSNVINTGATTGTIILDLAQFTTGNVTNGTGTVTGSPATIMPGVNTLTVTGAGTFTVVVNTVTTITLLDSTVGGTALDLTPLATAFGMSRWFMSSIIWIIITILICFAVYRGESKNSQFDTGDATGATRIIMYVFTVCVIGGTLLGLLHPLVGAVLFIACGAFIGYVLFFQSDALHKGVMFMAWMFLITSIAGGVVTGSTAIVATRLTANVPAGSVNTISVASTTGFPSSGIIVIGDERIGYPKKTATTFERASIAGVTTNPILRGVNGTTDAAHTSGTIVRTIEASVINSSIDYKVAKIADTAGIIGFVTLPAKLLDLLVAFFILPIGFLGTDMAILTYIWGIFAIGMIVGFGISLSGGRRV